MPIRDRIERNTQLGRRAGERATAENSVVPFNRLMSYRGVRGARGKGPRQKTAWCRSTG
ncbi:hypothetical protein O5759_07855 [Escherichia coli]|nr:hypothetical protein [Escherichia coli]MCZ5852644.1 hypothetical protein [Escherichia coli]